MKKSRGAFTLVELLMIMVIVGISTAIVAPKFMNNIKAYEYDTELRKMISDLRLMQQKAITEHKNYGIKVDSANACYSTGEWSGTAFVPSKTTCFDYAGINSSSNMNPAWVVYFNHLGLMDNSLGLSWTPYYQFRYSIDGSWVYKTVFIEEMGHFRLNTSY